MVVFMKTVLQVLAAAQAVSKAGQRLFKPHGISVAQFNVLNLLSDQSEGMRATDLARALIVDASNVTGLIRRMTAEGYLRPIENPADRRQHIVALSPKGQRVWAAASREYARALEEFEDGLKAADREATEKVLQKILTASMSTH